MQQTPHTQVTEIIEQMKNAAIRQDLKAIDACSNSLFALTASYMLPDVQFHYDARLTGQEARLLELLRRRAGHVLTKEHILYGLYYEKPDCDWPEEKIVDVFVCKLRSKLRGTGHVIETVWGVGYRYKLEAAA